MVEPKTEWPRVVDADSVAKRVERHRRAIRRLALLLVALVLGQALSVVGVLWKIDQDTQQRGARFCLLSQQAVNNATPDKPVDPLLLAAADVAGCSLDIPPFIRVR